MPLDRVGQVELDGAAAVRELELAEWQFVALVGGVGGHGEGGREAGVVEGEGARGGGRVHHDELVT